MSHLWTTIKALGVGVGLMYLLDPESGAGRRSKLRRQFLEVAAAAGDEADQLLATAGHKLAEQTCRMRSQLMHAVTGNGRHQPEAAATGAASTSQAEPKASACPMHDARLLSGLGGSLLVAYGLRSRSSPLSIAATALGVGLVVKAVLDEQAELAPGGAESETSRPTAPQDPDKGSRWSMAQP